MSRSGIRIVLLLSTALVATSVTAQQGPAAGKDDPEVATKGLADDPYGVQNRATGSAAGTKSKSY